MSPIKSFFNKAKGFPNYKKKGRHDSFTLDGSIHVDYKKIKVPVIGWIKTYEILPIGYCLGKSPPCGKAFRQQLWEPKHGAFRKPKSVTISRQGDKWFISWKIEVDINETQKKQDFVGVDLEDV